MKTKSALSYFGSDAGVAPELAAMLDGCKHVTIPFVGGASILPHLKARAIVCNDLNRAAVNFYRHLNGVNRRELVKMCCQTLSHPDELKDAWHAIKSNDARNVYEAWAYWAICWLGRKGKGGTREKISHASIRWSANGGTNASRIAAAASDLNEWARHFKRCEWCCLDFRVIAGKLKDQTDCGSYWDPPWVDAGRAYLHSFTEQDHRDMAAMLSEFRSHRIVIRYGDHEMIRDLYSAGQWNIVDARSRNQANAEIGEIWITNFEVLT